jgi:hypothetical protein
MTMTGPLADAPLTDDPFADDPFADDLGSRLAALAPRRTSRTTLALGGAVLVVAGFLGGVLVQKATNPATPSTPAVGPNGTGFGQGAGTGTGTGAQRGVTSGTVKLVDGTTIYVTTADGETVVVRTSGATTVTQARSSSVRELTPGTAVAVTGSADAEGIVTATQVTAQTSTR